MYLYEDAVWGERNAFNDKFIPSCPYCPSRDEEDNLPRDVREKGRGRGSGSHVFNPRKGSVRGREVVMGLGAELGPDRVNNRAISKDVEGGFWRILKKRTGGVICNFSFV